MPNFRGSVLAKGTENGVPPLSSSTLLDVGGPHWAEDSTSSLALTLISPTLAQKSDADWKSGGELALGGSSAPRAVSRLSQRSLPPVVATTIETQPFNPVACYAHVQQRLHRELALLKSSNTFSAGAAEAVSPVSVLQSAVPSSTEQYRVFREAAEQLSVQLERHAPVVGEVVRGLFEYIAILEEKCASVGLVEQQRDENAFKLAEAERLRRAEVKEAESRFDQRLQNIITTLKVHKSVDGLVQRIRQLEASIEAEKCVSADLTDKLRHVSFLRQEFEKSVTFIEDAFRVISHERDAELSEYRREKLRIHELLVSVQDDCRQITADMQMRLDAQQIALEVQMQRELFSADRTRDLLSYNLTLLQQVESLKKQLDEMNEKIRGDMAGRHEGSPTEGSQLDRIAEDLGFSRLSTPRPNKAEIVARVPDLGDPSKYPSTNAIIQALLNHYDVTAKRLQDADHTLNKLEERIEIVVLARAELLARERQAKGM